MSFSRHLLNAGIRIEPEMYTRSGIYLSCYLLSEWNLKIYQGSRAQTYQSLTFKSFIPLI